MPMKERYAVLMADDSEDDRLLMRLVFRNHPNLILVGEVSTGEEVKAYLSGTGTYSDRKIHPFPDLLLLDLKMPRLSGFDILDWLQTQSFPGLRVMVLSDSLHGENRNQSLQLGAHAYQ